MAKDLSKYLEEVRFVAGEKDCELRLDHFLMGKIFWRSRSDIQDRIKKGKILLRGAKSKASARLKLNDEVIVVITQEDLPDQDPRSIEINLIFENDEVVIVNKQAGVVVHPIGRHVYNTMLNALALRFKKAQTGEHPHVVHRLDRDTSGVLVVAKTQAAKKTLQEVFEERHPRKEYLAIVEGVIKEDEGEINAPLGRDDKADIRLKMCVREGGQTSRSHWFVEERFAAHTLVRVRIETGRQHQIRVHLLHLGFPVVADPLYGDPRSVGLFGEEPLLERQALHAALLQIKVPGTPIESEYCAGLPEDMNSVIEALRRGETLTKSRDVQSSRWRRA
ncbi:MAG: 23S rRNA pseudouridine1911/1915/1917 synthase [Planctomycetota bacterium]|jgi:23S rRNA pseudouridine1911/1915/1917 synthase